MKVNQSAQAWGFDLIIAGMIFLGGIILFYVYAINYPVEGQNTLDALFHEGEFIADSLLSEGHPDNWNENTVIGIGLSNNNIINKTKLQLMYNLSLSDYQKTKVLLNTKYEYFFNFSDPININETIIGIGNQPPQAPKNLIKISRLTIYDNKTTTLYVYTWE